MAVQPTENLEAKLNQTLDTIEKLKKTVTLFMSTYKTLTIKDRAKAISEIQRGLKDISSFIGTLKIEKKLNTAMSFKLDNVKNRNQSLINLWRRVEEKMYSE